MVTVAHSTDVDKGDAFCDGGSSPPMSLPVNPAGIPHELRECEQWVLWSYRWNIRASKFDKPPCGRVRTFQSAYNYYSRIGDASGIGFQLLPDDGYVVIDLDTCFDTGTGVLNEYAAGIVAMLDTYTERSVSGTGLHIWVRGSIPASRKAATIEMTSGGIGTKYLTVTGDVYHNAPIRACQGLCTALYDQSFPLMPLPTPVPVFGHSKGTGWQYTDDELLDIARCQRNAVRRARFIALYDEGEWEGAYPSQSEADCALACDLAWFIGDDAERLERLFSQSALGQREKWTMRPDYREGTCSRALYGRTKFYSVAKSPQSFGTSRREENR